MNDISNQPLSTKQEKVMSVGVAILVGQLVVNLPVLIIIFAISSVGIVFTTFLGLTLSFPGWVFPLGTIVSVAIGALIGWIWWSFSVPRWRKWALQKGTPEDQLQKWAMITGLVWPKGSIFEKTEFRVEE
jgi:hypothetical protein